MVPRIQELFELPCRRGGLTWVLPNFSGYGLSLDTNVSQAGPLALKGFT